MKSDQLPVDKKLILKLRLFAVIFLIMSVIGVFEVAAGNVKLLLASGSMLGGIAVGLVAGRMYNVTWNEATGKAIRKMDVVGVIILVGYILFAILRKELLGHWLKGHQLTGFIIWLYAGLMLGRFITLRRMIIKALKGHGL